MKTPMKQPVTLKRGHEECGHDNIDCGTCFTGFINCAKDTESETLTIKKRGKKRFKTKPFEGQQL